MEKILTDKEIAEALDEIRSINEEIRIHEVRKDEIFRSLDMDAVQKARIRFPSAITGDSVRVEKKPDWLPLRSADAGDTDTIEGKVWGFHIMHRNDEYADRNMCTYLRIRPKGSGRYVDIWVPDIVSVEKIGE